MFIFWKQVSEKLLEGLKILDQQKVIHRDLKPDNFFIDYLELDHSQIDTDNFKKCLTKKFLIKIGDFECARINSSVGTKPTIG